MADNYLEKKMEEHRQGVRPVFRRSPSGNKPHTFAMPCEIRGAFVIGDKELSETLLACACALRDASCRVAVCCSDKVFGNKSAQKFGLQYYPVADCEASTIDGALTHATEVFGNIDVILRESDGIIFADICGLKSQITAANGCTPKTVALALMYLTLPHSINLGLCGKFSINEEGKLSVVED